MQTLTLSAIWPDHRAITVDVRGRPREGVRTEVDEPPPDADPAVKPVFLADTDVRDLAAFRAYLRQLTRLMPDGASAVVDTWEQSVFRICALLDVMGPPPPVLVVRLADSAEPAPGHE